MAAFIEVIPAAPEQEPVLANLLELYAHDFSEFHDVELGADGRFGYASLPLYWREEGRYPFLIKVNGSLAGFALVKRERQVSTDETVWDMAEFFVVRRYRRRGIGTGAAQEVWRRFPGPWQVRVMDSNLSALKFWAGAIGSYADETICAVTVEKNGKWWRVFTFESKP